MAKRIRKSARNFTQVLESLNSTHIQWVGKRRKTYVDLRTNLSSTKVSASERKLNVSRKLASTCESVSRGLDMQKVKNGEGGYTVAI